MGVATISLWGILLLARGNLELAKAPTNPCYDHIDAAYDCSMYCQSSKLFCLFPGNKLPVGRPTLGQLSAASWTAGELPGSTPGPISLHPQKRHSQFTATTQFLKSSSRSSPEVNHLLPGSSLRLESSEEQRHFWSQTHPKQ